MAELDEKIKALDVLVGGMGVDVSGIDLISAAANHPSRRVSGSLSGTALAEVYVRRLQMGDPGAKIERAFEAFSARVPALTQEIQDLYKKFHIVGGKSADAKFRGMSMGGMTPARDVQIMIIAATFAHVWRAKQAAPGRPIGVNFLRKLERTLLYGLYGAMLAGADWIVMGAGDPSAVPGLLDSLARHELTELPMQVATCPLGEYKVSFDPKDLVGDAAAPARTPFLAIVSSHLQAEGLAANPVTRPDGFVIEGPLAGGHNAPPSKRAKDADGHYVYGPEDEADLRAVAAIGLPFWVAGGQAKPGGPFNRRQVGTIFALAKESGLEPSLRQKMLGLIWRQKERVVNDARASPSTYPFKIAQAPGTVGESAVYEDRKRVCDVGLLRGWRPKDGKVIGLCPADKPDLFKKAGGAAWRCAGAMCLCNGLLSAVGVGQPAEAPLITLGDTAPVRELQRQLKRLEYSAAEAAAFALGELKVPATPVAA
jgi:NAD(P)H-dependent flavin oxidoreductase YrpB (nitropropane dioxygenase family)